MRESGRTGRSTSEEDKTGSEIPVISYDFGYLRDTNHVAGDPGRPILVSVNTQHGYITSDMAPSKDHVYFVPRTIQNIADVQGHNRITWHGDQEPALKTVRSKIKLSKKIEILDGDAAVGDSQQHGAAENVVKTKVN